MLREVYRADVKKTEGAVKEQNYTLYLGGVRKENFAVEVAPGVTVSTLAKQAEVRMLGFLIEYQLDELEDLIIVSLLLYPSNEPKYICKCLNNRAKMPLHIFQADTEQTLQKLSSICPCNTNFHLYTK